MKCQMGKKCVGNGTTNNNVKVIWGKVVCGKCYDKLKAISKEMYKGKRYPSDSKRLTMIEELVLLQKRVNKR